MVAGLDARADDERAVARRRGDEQPRGLLEGPAVGHGQQDGLLCADARRVGTLRGAEDARPGLELAALGGRDDGSRELGAGDPGERCCSGVLASFAFLVLSCLVQSSCPLPDPQNMGNERMNVEDEKWEGGRGEREKRTRLVLVLALHLQDVEEVGRRGLDLDEVFVGLGRRVGQVNDLEIRRALRDSNLVSISDDIS